MTSWQGTLSTLLTLCEEKPSATGGFPVQRTQNVSLGAVYLLLAEHASEKTQWFVTPWCPCYVTDYGDVPWALRLWIGRVINFSSVLWQFKGWFSFDVCMWNAGGECHLNSYPDSSGQFVVGGVKPGPRLNINTVFPRHGVPMLKIRRSQDRLSLPWGSLYW